MQPTKLKWRSTFISGIGAILAITGATVALLWDDIFFFLLSKQKQLTPASRAYDIWKETPVPIYVEFHFFNWTNPEEFLDPTKKPAFVEMGPYRFFEKKTRVNVSFHDNNTVSYRNLRRWFYVEDEDNGNLDDEITSLNIVAASAVYTSRDWGYLRQKGLSLGLGMFHETIEITKTVRELLFEGYVDPLLDFANSLPRSASGGVPPTDRFGWFYKRNGSALSDGYINMETGVGDIGMLGKVRSWNNASTTTFYSGQCSNVEGTNGEFYPPRVKKGEGITFFSPDICRSLSFDFDEVIENKGIQAYKFSANKKVMDNGSFYEPNKCYCPGICQPSGVLNVSSCRLGSPAFVSFPHFYLADDYYLNAVEGLNPSKENHSFYITLEPTTGIPVDVAARIQINVLVQPSEHVALYENVPRVFMPIFWFEQRVTLGDDFADMIRQLLKLPLIGNIVALSVFVIGIIVLLWYPVKVNMKVCLGKQNSNKEDVIDAIALNNTSPQESEVCMLPNAINNMEKINEDSENDSDNESKEPLKEKDL